MRKKATPLPITIAPSVLSADFSRLGSQIKESVRCGCPWIHLDIMDNHFVPNLTFGPPVVKSLRKVSKKAYFDAHLMTEAPEGLIEAFANAGVENLTVHEEACRGNLKSIIKQIHSFDMKAGVAIKPNTPLETVFSVLEEIELLLIMTVEPGFGGQSLLPGCLNKLREARQLRDKRKLSFILQADGGVNANTIGLVVAAGAEVLVAGSAVFNDEPLADNVAKMLKNLR